MKTKNLLPLFLVLASVVSVAQQKLFRPTGSVFFGATEGEQGGCMQLGATAGVKAKTWSTEIGSGLDYYGVRSIPLYLRVEKKVLDGLQTPFVYVDGGYHFPWPKNAVSNWWNETKYTGGIYYGAGLGYQAPAIKSIALFFAAGYSFKQFREEMTQRYECFAAPCPEYNEKIKFGLRRLSLTAGFRF